MNSPAEENSSSRKRKRSQRGKVSKQNKRARQLVNYHEEIVKRRTKEMDRRDTKVFTKPLTPILHETYSKYSPNTNKVSECTKQFYSEHLGMNKYVEVRGGKSIANPRGTNKQRSVWAKMDIPKDTYICPYVGEVSNIYKPRDRYVASVFEDIYISARNVMYDVGYMLYMEHGINSEIACVENFGRYINTINKHNRQQSEMYEYNCIFEMEDDGYDEMWVKAKKLIPANTELIVDYGKDFVV